MWCQQCLTCGSDGGRTFTYDFSNHKLHERQEIIDPLPLPPCKRVSQGRYSVPLTQIPQEQWEEVAHRNSSGESLRSLAKDYSVSYEAVRQVVKRAVAEVQSIAAS
jgi:hypothetical protein